MTRRAAGARPHAPALASLFVLVLVALVPAPAGAARWDTYNNANSLTSITATRGVVWTASDLGVHRYDPATGSFTRFSKNVGQLASNAVTEVEVDAGGNTWFATRGNGVSVLQAGGTWRTLTRFDGLPADTVLCLEPSASGMWVGTNAGLSLFDGLELIASWPDGINPSPFARNQIVALAHVGDSTWVGTPAGAYVTRSAEGVTWSLRDAGLASSSIRSLAAFGPAVWCVAGGRVYRDGQTGAWTEAAEGLPPTTAYTIAAHGDSLLLGTGAGVFVRTAAEPTWQLLGVGFPVRAWVEFADDGAPWAGNVEGLWRWLPSGWTRFDIPGPGGNDVLNIALEGSRPWIATRERGIARFDGTSWRTYSPLPGALPDTSLLSSDFVFAIFADSRGTKWIGDWGSAISTLDDRGAVPAFTHHFDAAEGNFDKFNTFGWSTAEDPSGNVWIGLDTDNAGQLPAPYGLHRFSPDGTQRARFDPLNAAMTYSHVRAIAFAPGPAFEMWVGYADRGIDIFTDPTLQTRSGRLSELEDEGELPDNDMWGIAFFGDSVWVGQGAGFARYSRADRERKEVIGTSAPSQGAVHPLDVDAEGGVWWATQVGLFHRRRDKSIEVFTSANSPLLSDVIRAVTVDRATGDIWIGTDRGVNRYDPDATTNPIPAGVSSFTVYPNPTYMSSAGVRLFGVGIGGPFSGRVVDIRGRTVRTLSGNATNGGLWDAKDENGRRVGAGIYFISVTQSGVTRTGRVLLVR